MTTSIEYLETLALRAELRAEQATTKEDHDHWMRQAAIYWLSHWRAWRETL